MKYTFPVLFISMQSYFLSSLRNFFTISCSAGLQVILYLRKTLSFSYFCWVQNFRLTVLPSTASSLKMLLYCLSYSFPTRTCSHSHFVFVLLLLFMWFFSSGYLSHFPFFSGFLSFNSNIPWCSFLHSFCVWGLLRFLDLWVYGSHQIWKHFCPLCLPMSTPSLRILIKCVLGQLCSTAY